MTMAKKSDLKSAVEFEDVFGVNGCYYYR